MSITRNAKTKVYLNLILRIFSRCSNKSLNDFRLDFFTKPTLPILEAIITTSLRDGNIDKN
ncbi:uncharacterized protein K441DRAFT_724188 [Cenococcum geophilum 1.58]|uniref:uncharacterized protein n=1 Tax=Cenococcum geophilum 1.58 TaxID=794803 RepID=UPI00358EF6DE|nr:hypothetical protein K441DRAFT_724188 [Cenococcum geophilum 1.58]